MNIRTNYPLPVALPTGSVTEPTRSEDGYNIIAKVLNVDTYYSPTTTPTTNIVDIMTPSKNYTLNLLITTNNTPLLNGDVINIATHTAWKINNNSNWLC
eukprot:UN07989